MAIIHNQVGSLSELLQKLNLQGAHDLHTFAKIKNFEDSFQSSLSSVEKTSKDTILQDINNLESEQNNFIIELNEKLAIKDVELQDEKKFLDMRINSIPKEKSEILTIINWFRKRRWLKRKTVLEANFEDEKLRPFKKLSQKIKSLKNEIANKKTNIDRLIDDLSKKEAIRMSNIHAVIEKNKNLFYGAIGEEHTLSELKKLPDSYVVINDYREKFRKGIHDRKNNDWIYSVQIDHIVVGPTGIYLIETKNWSTDSIENHDFFAPVSQLQRSGFAMFVLLNQAYFPPLMNSWGKSKITFKNIVVLMNHKPKEEFQYVKILLPSEVNGYITYGTKVFTQQAVDSIVNFLL